MSHRRRFRVILSLLLLLHLLHLSVACTGERPGARIEPPPTMGGAVASAEAAATDTGLSILADGGNAVDAAVGVALVLAVVHPQAGNLGGGGFALVRFGDEVQALDFRETAPAAARRDMYLDPEGEPIKDASEVGPLSAGVPGSPAGLYELHSRFGRLPWRSVVEPAVVMARDGFEVSARLNQAIGWMQEDLATFSETAAIWLPGGAPPPTGSMLKIPDLARTLRAYAEKGPEAITKGEIAAAIERSSRDHGGILTQADLAGYRPVWRDPVRFKAFGWEFASMPLPSSGGIILGQTLLLMESLDWSSHPRGDAARVHLLVEAWRRSYADRFILGAPEHSVATSVQLLAPEWIRRRASEIDPARATPSTDVGPWPDRTRPESGETTHLSVVDGSGNVVALTTTLNGWFGSLLNVSGAGFLLNNEMDDFTTAPGRPNMYRLIQGEANAVRPGVRMLSSMSPTVAWRGEEAIAIGSPGGSRIPTSTAQVLLNIIVDGNGLEEAVAGKRFHHQWQPDEIVIEAGVFSEEVRRRLEGMGHALRKTDWRIGEVDVVRRLADGSSEAAADPRGPGAAGAIDPPR